MPVIVYNTTYDPDYRNASAVSPAIETQVPGLNRTCGTTVPSDLKKIVPSTIMEKYFFMAVIVIGLGVLIYKYKHK